MSTDLYCKNLHVVFIIQSSLMFFLALKTAKIFLPCILCPLKGLFHNIWEHPAGGRYKKLDRFAE